MENKNIEDYKQEIFIMVNAIDDLPRIFRLWSYIKKVFQIYEEEKEA